MWGFVAAIVLSFIFCSGPLILLATILPSSILLGGAIFFSIFVLWFRWAWLSGRFYDHGVLVTPSFAQLSKKYIVLVTGGNRGIGFEVAKSLSLTGDHCVLLAARDKPAGQEAIAELEFLGGTAMAITVDVSSSQSITLAAKSVMKHFGRLDVLVNNAAISLGPSGKGQSLEGRRQTIQTNVFGALAMSDAFGGALKASHVGGHIINVGSRRGLLVLDNNPTLTEPVVHACTDRRALTVLCRRLELCHAPWPSDPDVYGASKMLLCIVTKILATEHQRYGTGVVVSVVCPGFVRTRMGGPMAPLTPAQGAMVVSDLVKKDVRNIESGLFWTENGGQCMEKLQ